MALFLEGRIGFRRIGQLAAGVLDWDLPAGGTVDDLLQADRETREKIAAQAVDRAR